MMPGMIHEREVLASRVAGSHTIPRTSRLDRSLSLAGAAALLALALVGPAGLVVTAAIVAVAAATAALGRGRRRPGTAGPPPARTGRTAPELMDRWRAWRVAEPDAEFLKGRAA